MLSFNYTSPIINKTDKIRNIHGRLEEDNIIFGIDYDSLVDIFKKDNPLKLSKSFRILEQEFEKSNNVIINPNINYIKFFGHSLSDADYSYFQAMFDAVDIYNSDTVLIFFGAIMNPKKEKKFIVILSYR
ncbi:MULTISPECIES: AbiH family protein [unclassified Lactococcus]|uniref:AbiH family protein n=1 Tax=unclassified Lactococcus TaxID=2643510 RepID=UPI00272DDBF3|nr:MULTISPECIES: AbiH family protein [unclassified Lactococcus]